MSAPSTGVDNDGESYPLLRRESRNSASPSSSSINSFELEGEQEVQLASSGRGYGTTSCLTTPNDRTPMTPPAAHASLTKTATGRRTPTARPIPPYAVVGVPVVPINCSPTTAHKDVTATFGEDYRDRERIGEFHTRLATGVGDDITAAQIAARKSAARDNAVFKQQAIVKGRQRVEEERRAVELARLNAARRDIEGLSMRPHPGNRLEVDNCEPADSARAKVAKEEEARRSRVRKGDVGPDLDLKQARGTGEKAGGRVGSGNISSSAVANEGSDESKNKKTSGGGYQFAEYEPTPYDCTEYKSMYDP